MVGTLVWEAGRLGAAAGHRFRMRTSRAFPLSGTKATLKLQFGVAFFFSRLGEDSSNAPCQKAGTGGGSNQSGKARNAGIGRSSGPFSRTDCAPIADTQRAS